jgi:hypothetical protein
MQIKPWLRGETRNEVKMDRLHVGSSAPACSALRPTDDEIELEARQWAVCHALREYAGHATGDFRRWCALGSGGGATW